jgi:hypothetical protein
MKISETRTVLRTAAANAGDSTPYTDAFLDQATRAIGNELARRCELTLTVTEITLADGDDALPLIHADFRRERLRGLQLLQHLGVNQAVGLQRRPTVHHPVANGMWGLHVALCEQAANTGQHVLLAAQWHVFLANGLAKGTLNTKFGAGAAHAVCGTAEQACGVVRAQRVQGVNPEFQRG